MHPDQLPIDISVAARLVRDQFPTAATDTIEPLNTAATTSYVFRVGAGYSARFPMRQGSAQAFRRELAVEHEAMSEFAAASPFPSPRLVFIGRPGFGYPMPWSVQTWIHGDVATPRSVASSSAFARDLVRLVRALRAVDVRGRVFSGSGRGGDLTGHDEWVAHCLTKSASLLPVERLRAAWDALRVTARVGPDVMSHKDLIPFNLLACAGRLSGVLDTGGFGPADPALDLVVGWHALDRERRAEFRAGVGADDAEWRRSAAWALQQALGLV
jgi:aminoglycoside phosphotransferase (APT) family kinase protein